MPSRTHSDVDTLSAGDSTGEVSEYDQRIRKALRRYMSRGIRCFPLAPGQKTPMVKDWEQWAHCDIARIENWPPGAGIGIALGPSGLLTVDCDMPKESDGPPPPEWADCSNGMESFDKLHRIHGVEPVDTWTTKTAREGSHSFYRVPAHAAYPSSIGKLAWKVDVKSSGGYVVGAPTKTQDGVYRIQTPTLMARKLPCWLNTALSDLGSSTRNRKPGKVQDRLPGVLSRIRAITSDRNTNLFTEAVFAFEADGGSSGAVVEQVLDAASSLQAPDFTNREIETTVASALKRARANAIQRTAGVEPDTAGKKLKFVSAAAFDADVRSRPPRQWLIEGIWAQGLYGIIAGAAKTQKSWNAYDMAIAVAAGTSWLGRFPVRRQGPVVVFVGEGGDEGTHQRLSALAREHGVELADLPIYLCFQAPKLLNEDHLREIEELVETVKPALVIIDPLYLSAAGGKMGDLYSMGELLLGAQSICEPRGAALLIVHHFNRGEGSGATRLMGAGPLEWARVIITAEVMQDVTDPVTKESDVRVRFTSIGGELPGEDFEVQRLIRRLDPLDINSPFLVKTVAGHTTGRTGKDPNESVVTGTRKKRKAGASSRNKILRALAKLGDDQTYAAVAKVAGLDRSVISKVVRNDLAPEGLVTFSSTTPVTISFTDKGRDGAGA